MVCPKCKSEIDADSLFCDQCGQEIKYCQSCKRVGKGNRCTACGGRMITAAEHSGIKTQQILVPKANLSVNEFQPVEGCDFATIKVPNPTPIRLVLSNSLFGINIEGSDGAIIGRRSGIYNQLFARFPYVSGNHAKLKFDFNRNKWTITDMNSSNGTKYNGNSLNPNEPCDLENGATLQLANVVFNVTII